MKRIVLVLALAGCRQLAGLNDPLPGDGTSDGPLTDGPPGDVPKVMTCYGTGMLEICLDDQGRGDVSLPATLSSSDGSPDCATNVVSGGNGLCVVIAANLTIPSGATTRASGSKPLVLIAHDTITIAGTLDAASHRTGGRGPAGNFSGCGNAASPPTDGGGAGGSFGGLGGAGGAPGTNTPATAPAPTTLHGGCEGRNGGGVEAGTAGDGGGAVYLIAKGEIDVSGAVNASGAGASDGEDGNTSGGGGGGSGGMIGLDAPDVTVTGLVFANGGGGGEGADGIQKGANGGDPIDAAAGLGGNGGGSGGPGGNGGAAGNLDGLPGTDGVVGVDGGGGGGGSVGVILLFGTRGGVGTISPAPT